MSSRTGRAWREVWLMLGATVFVLQILLGAAMAAGAAASPSLDAFGNPLCITHETKGDGGDHGGGKLPGCCAAACSMAFSSAVPALSAPQPAHPPAIAQVRPQLDMRQAVRQVLRPETDPGNPRAPPLETL